MKITITLLATFIVSSVFAQMIGTYTIDKTTTSSATNFINFADAIDSLESQGLSGNVRLSVVKGSGPYTEQVTIPQLIGSNSYSLTINGNDEELNLNDSTSLGGYVVAFDSAKNCILKNLNIRGLSYSKTPTCIEIKHGSQNISILDNELFSPESNDYNYGYTVGILIADSIFMDNTYVPEIYHNEPLNLRPIGGNSVNVLVKNNSIQNSMFSIFAMYNTQYVGQNAFENNEIIDFVHTGIFVGGGNDLIKNNIISRSNIPTTFFQNEAIFGIRASGGNYTGSIKILENTIRDLKDNNQGAGTWHRCAIASDAGKQVGIFSYLESTDQYNVEIKDNIIDLEDLPFCRIIFTGNRGNTIIDNNEIQLISSVNQYDRIVGIYTKDILGKSNNGNTSITNNSINIDYSGEWYGLLSNLSGIWAHSMSDSNLIANNIITFSASNVQRVPNNVKPSFLERSNGIEGIYIKGKMSTESIVAYNDIIIKENVDDTLNSVAFRLEDGSSTLTNNLVTFNNMVERATVLETNTSAIWSATHNSIYADSGIIFFHENVTGSNDLTISDFNTRSRGTNLEANPNFVDINDGDYRPKNTDILNGGTPLTSVLTDHYGTVRPTTTPDIGAIEVFTNNSLSAKSIENKELKIYPNPVNDFLWISNASAKAKIDLYNMLGVNVLSTKGNSLDVAGFTAGIYIIKVTEGNITTSRRIVIE